MDWTDPQWTLPWASPWPAPPPATPSLPASPPRPPPGGTWPPPGPPPRPAQPRCWSAWSRSSCRRWSARRWSSGHHSCTSQDYHQEVRGRITCLGWGRWPRSDGPPGWNHWPRRRSRRPSSQSDPDRLQYTWSQNHHFPINNWLHAGLDILFKLTVLLIFSVSRWKTRTSRVLPWNEYFSRNTSPPRSSV